MNKFVKNIFTQTKDLLFINTPPQPKKSHYKTAALLIIATFFVIFCRFASIWFVPDVFADEQEILNHMVSIISSGYDADGNYMPLYPRVGSGLATFVYLYPMIAFSLVTGVSCVRARFIQQVLTISACFLVAIATKIWSKNAKFFWITLFTTLTLPWGFVQANRIWDPSFVPVYFSVYFLFFTLLINSDTLTSFKKYIYSIISFTFLVLLATVYPPVRIPAVAMWIYSLIWVIKSKKITTKHVVAIFISSTIISLPLAINLMNPAFNSRARGLLVFNGEGILYQQIYQYVQNFVSLFNPEFLFFTGDWVYRHSLPIFGMLGTLSIIPLFILFRQKKYSPLTIYMVFVIVSNCLSVALTNDYQPHGLRSCLSWMPFSILIACGWYDFFEKRSKNGKILWYGICTSFFVIYFALYILISKGFITLYV